ncbi:MAG TPA: RodZ domain-containing protein [Nocardioidaceae bacterium]|nr:RodZ domain-containing protein [Nocardioidaceae bacterium]
MSAMPHELHDDDAVRPPSTDDTALRAPVVVRRNAGLAALIGAAASAIAIAYLWRASQTGLLVDWALCAVMAVIAAAYLAALVDSRTPLLVADDLGVRLRLGSQWRGLPWEALGEVLVRPRRGLLRDGTLMFAPRSADRAMAGLDARGRWHARLNARMYGAALAVPMGMTTRLSTDRAVRDALAALAAGRVEVVEAVPSPGPSPAGKPIAERAAGPAARPAAGLAAGPLIGRSASEPVAVDAEPVTAPRRTLFGTLGTIVSRAAKRPEPERSDPAPAPVERPPAGPALPLRPTRPALRAEVTREAPATIGNAALHLDPAEDGGNDDVLRERGTLHRPGSVDLVLEPPAQSRVRPIARAGAAVEPLVIDEFVVEPAYDPVIGPELAAARTRLGLSVDDLAERTRIRPHVLESIEVDDFAPCGGDFYARGHLRTLARVLGKDPAPLLAAFEERYATAPLNARRVFEAELATGMTGSMRRTVGGPSWGILVGAVLCVVIVWGLVRLFAGTPQEHLVPAPTVQPAAAAKNAYPQSAAPVAVPMRVSLVAVRSTGTVVVRDGQGRIRFSGTLDPGQPKHLRVTPPVHVRAADAGAVDVLVRGRDLGSVGADGRPGHRTFHR